MRIVLTIFVLAIVGCSNRPVNSTIVLRVPDPSSSLEAVVVEKVGGPIKECDYDVYLLRADQDLSVENRVASLVAAHSNVRSYGVNARWTSSDTLAIRYLAAESTVLTNSNGAVAVDLECGICDPTAPFANMAAPTEMEDATEELMRQWCEGCTSCVVEAQQWPLVYTHVAP